MKTITLTPQTIAAMHAYRDIVRDICEDSGIDSMEGVEIRQGDYTIVADYKASSELVEDEMVHSEVCAPNIEDLSYIVCTGVDIDNVHAFDDDGEEYGINNLKEVVC